MIRRSVRSPDGTRPDNRLLWELTERKGLVQLDVLRAEIATVPAFESLMNSSLKEDGVLLEQAVAAAV
jgi:hypothetical protein